MKWLELWIAIRVIGEVTSGIIIVIIIAWFLISTWKETNKK